MAASRAAAQFLRFAVVGCLNVMVSFVVFYVFYRLWPVASSLLEILGEAGSEIQLRLAASGIGTPDATLANILGYAAGIMNSFVLNKIWTFQARGNVTRQLHRFVLLNLLGLAISTLIVFVFVDLLAGPYLLVWSTAIAIVMVLNFLGQRHWAFADGLPSKAPN